MVLKINKAQRSHSSSYLNEVSRRDLLTKSRQGSKKRFKKRLNYQVPNFRGVDLRELFENDYFVFQAPVNDYVCTIAYPGVLTELREVMKATHGDIRKVNLQLVIKALRRSFDKADDIKVRCTCADFKYRFMYWANKYDYLYGAPDPGTEDFPEKTNPDDNLGATCKHLDLFLSNKKWLVKAASVVNALIKTYPDKAQTYLYDPDEIVDTEVPEEIEDDTPEVTPVDGKKRDTKGTEEVPNEETDDKSEDEEGTPETDEESPSDEDQK